MESVTINNVTIPLHWDDRYYLADCGGCGEELFARTTAEMAEKITAHQCQAFCWHQGGIDHQGSCWHQGIGISRDFAGTTLAWVACVLTIQQGVQVIPDTYHTHLQNIQIFPNMKIYSDLQLYSITK